MAGFKGKSPASTFNAILTMDYNNEGLTDNLKSVKDAQGNESALELSKVKVRIKGNNDVFDVVDSNNNIIFTINTTTKEVTAGSGVKFVGDGSSLSGITGATGGVSNTSSTNIVADSDANGSGDITLSIGSTEIARIANNGSGNGGSFVLKSLNEDALATLTGSDIALANVGGKAYVQDADGIHGVVLADKYSDPKGGYVFDGMDDYVEIANNPNLELTSDFSIAFWAKITGGLEGAYFFNGSDGYNAGVRCVLNGSGKLNFQCGTGSDYIGAVDGATAIDYSNWHYVVVTNSKSGTTNNITVYVNGRFYSNRTLTGDIGYNATGARTRIMPYTGGGLSDYLEGKLIGFQFYNYTLSQSEITQLYNNGSPETAVIPYELQGASQTEVVVDSGFDDASKWETSTAVTIDEVNSKAVFNMTDTSYQYVRQGNTLEKGKRCKLTIEVTAYTSGDLQFIGASSVNIPLSNLEGDGAINGVGTYTYYFTAEQPTGYIGLARLANTTCVMEIGSMSIVQIGNVLDLKPDNAGSNAWVGTLGSEPVEANVFGNPIAMGNLRDGRNGISTTEVILTDTHKAGYLLEGIVAINKAGGDNHITIGTTSNGNDIADNLLIAKDGSIYIPVNQFATETRNLYASAEQPSADLVLVYKKIN